MKKIVVDIGGCDHPQKMIGGCVAAAEEFKNYCVAIVGDEGVIKPCLPAKRPDNIEIVHAPDLITNDDSPTKAIRQKPDSSLVRAISVLNGDEDAIGLVSGGSTGAVLTGATLLVGRIKGVYIGLSNSFFIEPV